MSVEQGGLLQRGLKQLDRPFTLADFDDPGNDKTLKMVLSLAFGFAAGALIMSKTQFAPYAVLGGAAAAACSLALMHSDA